MTEYFFIKSSYRIAAIIAVALFVQFQFGCSLIKSVTSGNNSTANSSSTGGGKTVGDSDNSTAETPEVCRNSYYPVGANVERKYHIKYQKMANLDQDYTERFSNFSNNEFASNTSFKDVVSNINWRCLPDGLLATQYGNSIDMKQGGSAKIDTVNSSGVTYPAESEWSAGKKWTTVYNIKESIQSPNGQTGNVDATGTVNQNGEIIGAEEVTVPAGTFQTMKVKVATTLDLTVNVMGRSIPTKTNVQTTAWFAKDVGMVKSQVDMGGIDSGTAELLSYAGTK